MAMIPNTPWLKTVPQFDDEAIASVAVRLAPMGRIDTDTLLRLHLDMPGQSVSTIATRPEAIAELGALGSFDLDRLSFGAWKIFKDRTRFLGREMPVGWFIPELRRVAPAKLLADGDGARIRNDWLVVAMPCDLETGEVLLDRCPACLSLLGWKNLRNVWSCQACEFDLRTAAPRWCLSEEMTAANELADFIVDPDDKLPSALVALPFLDVLKLASWLTYFRAIPQELSLGITAKNSALGFFQLKRWPMSFDEVVLDLLGVSGANDLAAGDAITRSKAAAGIIACIDRLPSTKARDFVKSRLMEFLGLDHEFIASASSVMEPILPLGIAISHFDSRGSTPRARARISRGPNPRC
jgi:hypothetical protein